MTFFYFQKKKNNFTQNFRTSTHEQDIGRVCSCVRKQIKIIINTNLRLNAIFGIHIFEG